MISIACLADVAFFPGRLGAGFFDLAQRVTSVISQAAARIAFQELLKRGLGALVVFKVIPVDLSDDEQGFDAMLAAGILAAQELVLRDRGLGDLGVAQSAAHLGQ